MFFGYFQSHLTKTKVVKDIFSSYVFAKDTSNISPNNISTKNIHILDSNISVKLFNTNQLLSIAILLIKQNFINIFLNLIRLYSSLMIIDLLYILKKL